MAARLTASKIDRGQRSERSGHYEMDYNSLKVQFRTIYIYTVELDCSLNVLRWRRFVLCGVLVHSDDGCRACVAAAALATAASWAALAVFCCQSLRYTAPG